MEIPVLRTQRLTLRGHSEEDLEASAAMWSHADVVRYIGGKPFDREAVWHRILRYRGHWVLRGFGYWAIFERSTNCFVGEIGLADWKRNSLSDLAGLPEAGWALSPQFHGRGYAGEALGRVLGWSDTVLATPTICIVGEENIRSIILAEQVGYVRLTERKTATIRFQRPMGGLG